MPSGALLIQSGGGFRWITVILDNATIHRAAMKAAAAELLAEIAENPAWTDLKNINLEFLHAPSHSPEFNPAEYLLHWIRQEALCWNRGYGNNGMENRVKPVVKP